MAQRFSQLSPQRQALLRQCQRIEIGRFLVRDCEPVLTFETEIFFDLKLDGKDGQRPEENLSDFELSTEVVRLFAKLDVIRNGVVKRLDVYAGLPRRIVFKTSDLVHW